jgi:hypothetical protein
MTTDRSNFHTPCPDVGQNMTKAPFTVFSAPAVNILFTVSG